MVGLLDIAQRGFARRPEPRARPVAAGLTPLDAIPADAWRRLAADAIEPNGYDLPDWVRASHHGDATRALTAYRDGGVLCGVLPVRSAWQSLKLPLPALVSADPFHALATPLLLDDDAAAALLAQARACGAHALILRYVTLDGPALQSLERALIASGLRTRILRSGVRASLDARADVETALRDSVTAKKRKELGRLRRRLAMHGDVAFHVARDPVDVAPAFDDFLALEASGWKGRRGTALAQSGDTAARLKQAAVALAAHGQCEIATLTAGCTPVAAGLVLRHRDRAFFFKLGIDERFAAFSPGSLLTLDLTRHLCADPVIAFADSTAAPGSAMIESIWRGRLAIGDVMLPLIRNDPLTPVIETALRAHGRLRAAARARSKA